MSELRNRLKELRINRGLQQKEIADKIGVSPASYSLYERGEREPSIATLKNLAYLFNVTLDSLLENEINIIEPSLDELRNEVADLRYSLNEKGLRKVADYMYDLIEIKKYKIGN